ncbi:MAG: adenosylcobinamide-GDP ribazoletransferase [bacterium]
MIQGFFEAVQFLTVCSITNTKKYNIKNIKTGLIFFPVVGLLLGLILAGINQLLRFYVDQRLFTAAIVVFALVILTRGIHLDGLADTFDGIIGGWDTKSRLNIMRDPHIGVWGILSLLGVILFKIIALSTLPETQLNISIILSCIISRFVLIFVMKTFPYARTKGKAKVFYDGIKPRVFYTTLIISLALSFLIGSFKGIMLLASSMIFAYIAGKYISKKIGGVTGDTLGAISELTEVLVLMMITII